MNHCAPGEPIEQADPRQVTRGRKIGVVGGSSVAITAFCLLLTWVPGRVFHLPGFGLFLSKMLFPFCHVVWSVHRGEGAAALPSGFWFLVLQFPLYGLFVCVAWLRNRLRDSLLTVAVIHGLAVLAAFIAGLYVAG